MGKKTRSLFVWAAIILLCLGDKSMCFAGEINRHEAKIVSAANGTFEYDGVTYRAKAAYKAQLAAKLSEDDIDLTAEQSEEAIAMMYANVAAGVEEGYLESVKGKKHKKKEASETQKKDSEIEKYNYTKNIIRKP